MININKYIFYNYCDKNIDTYIDIIGTIKKDYFYNINLLKYTTDCNIIRKIIHTLVGIVSIFDNTNIEINYLLKTILNIDKNIDNFSLYKEYINSLINYDTTNLF
jgi:hypothetical protein